MRNYPLASLSPYLDDSGCLRVGGRLQNSALPSKMAHPLLLSTTSRIVQLLVNNAHTSAMHAGPSTILSNISRDYFIPGVK